MVWVEHGLIIELVRVGLLYLAGTLGLLKRYLLVVRFVRRLSLLGSKAYLYYLHGIVGGVDNLLDLWDNVVDRQADSLTD